MPRLSNLDATAVLSVSCRIVGGRRDADDAADAKMSWRRRVYTEMCAGGRVRYRAGLKTAWNVEPI